MQDPIITIVVPVYKVPEELLHKCLKSIEAQTSKHFEAILVDDGSPDDCGRICDEYAKRNDNFRVIHQKNSGLSVVRNVGIDNARAPWVCFVDGDDWIEPSTIEFAEQYIHDCPDGDVLIWEEYFDIGNDVRDNCFLGTNVDKTRKFESKECEMLIDLILPEDPIPKRNSFAGIGTANARLYRRNFLIDNSLYNKPGLKRMQDTVFNLWVFDKAQKVYYRCERLYHYVVNEEAATKRYTNDIADTMYFLFECYRDFIISTGRLTYMSRLYLKFVRIIAQCFELNYAHPENKLSLLERRKTVKKDMQRPYFKEAIDNADPTGQGMKIRLILFLLRRKLYYSLMVVTRLNVITRAYRLKH